jgi:6-phosphogluconolactonase
MGDAGRSPLRIVRLHNAQWAAQAAADHIAAALREAIDDRGTATLALSGGKSPSRMLAALALAEVEWHAVDIFQVDERVAAAGDADRNAVSLRDKLIEPVGLAPERIHLMPVEEPDLIAAAAGYDALLRRYAGTPVTLDVVHLGLGSDGHTASLIPADPVLDEKETAVAITRPYQGRRRMTLTLPVLDRALQRVWLVTGADKAQALALLERGDRTIPAGRVDPRHATVFTDIAAHGSTDSFSNGT